MNQNIIIEMINDTVELYSVLSSEGCIRYISSNCVEYLGYRQEELIGNKLQDFIHTDDLFLLESYFYNDHLIYPCTFRFRHKNGSYTWLEVKIDFIHNSLKENEREVVVKFHSHQSEASLLNTETWNTTSSPLSIESCKDLNDAAQLVEHMPCPLLILVEGFIQYANVACLNLLGAKSLEDVHEKNIFQFVHPQHHVMFKKRIHQLHNGLTVGFSEQAWKRLDGEIIDVEIRTSFVTYKGRNAELVILNDLSSQKKFHTYLQKSRERYQRLIQNSIDTIAVIHKDKWVFMNESGIKLFGASDYTDVIGKNIYSFLHHEYHQKVKEKLNQVMNGQTEVVVTRQNWISRTKQIVFTEMVCIPTTYFDDPAVQIILRDLTERKKTEEMMLQSEKLSLVGQLAAGIAHEIRNPLTAIKGFLQLMKSEKNENSQYLEIVFSELNRMEIILSELLMLAKPQQSMFKKENIHNALTEVILLLETEAHLNNVLIEKHLYSECEHVYCDQNQLKQVFINLIKNAIEAMPKGGVISITTKTESDGVTIIIEDNGEGIPEEILKKIGQPFVTTKEKGTGLGLMITYKIIENHQGTIEVKSEKEKGTIFTIKLPFEMNEEKEEKKSS